MHFDSDQQLSSSTPTQPLLLWFAVTLNIPVLPLGSSIRASCLKITVLNIRELNITGLKFPIEGKNQASV